MKRIKSERKIKSRKMIKRKSKSTSEIKPPKYSLTPALSLAPNPLPTLDHPLKLPLALFRGQFSSNAGYPYSVESI
jgi:hypothetical protein